MDRRVRENFIYVGGELLSCFGKPMLFLCLVFALGSGIVWGFQKVDAYLTPSYAKEEEEKKEPAEAHITIPAIGVNAPLSFVVSTNPDDFLEPLKKGVVHYPSTLPGQKGASIILGHSAPVGWFGSTYEKVFSDLKDLERGDTISLNVNGESYTYSVSAKFFLDRGKDIPEVLTQTDRSRILLLSCWPPGINNKRIMIQADEL